MTLVAGKSLLDLFCITLLLSYRTLREWLNANTRSSEELISRLAPLCSYSTWSTCSSSAGGQVPSAFAHFSLCYKDAATHSDFLLLRVVCPLEALLAGTKHPRNHMLCPCHPWPTMLRLAGQFQQSSFVPAPFQRSTPLTGSLRTPHFGASLFLWVILLYIDLR